MPDTAFWQSQFLGMMHSRPARTLFEWCSHSVNVLWGANCFNTSTFLLNSWASLFKIVYPRLYGMSWQHYCFDESRISCEIHVGRRCSYRCSYKMILWWKLNTIHGHTTWQYHSPSPLKLKIEKHRCQITWFTGGLCIITFEVLTVVLLRIHVLWDVMLCCWMNDSWYFEGL